MSTESDRITQERILQLEAQVRGLIEIVAHLCDTADLIELHIESPHRDWRNGARVSWSCEYGGDYRGGDSIR